jgi:hypothetical protein
MESAAHEVPRSAVPPLVRELEETLTSYLQVGGVGGCNYKRGEERRGEAAHCLPRLTPHAAKIMRHYPSPCPCLAFLQPFAFFVSWNGVLTLAFAGFTPALLDLKRRVATAHPALPRENPGSLWPKASLGCLRDGVTLTEQQFHTLNGLCK